MALKKTFFALFVLFFLQTHAQVGFNCQFIPGIQTGKINVTTSRTQIGSYNYSAALPVFMIDRIKGKWYSNLDMGALYYATTQINNTNAGKIAIAKTEGSLFSFRFGYGFIKNEKIKIGPYLTLGWLASNLDSSRKVLNVPNYGALGGGIFYYQRFTNNLHSLVKVGYEKFKNNSANSNIKWLTGNGIYAEATAAYNIYQNFGIALMGSYNRKTFNYVYSGEKSTIDTKLNAFAIRLGLTKFF